MARTVPSPMVTEESRDKSLDARDKVDADLERKEVSKDLGKVHEVLLKKSLLCWKPFPILKS